MKVTKLFFILFCLIGIHISAQTNTAQKKKSKKKTAKSATVTVKPEPQGTKHTISGKVIQTSSYCGGAAPSPDMLKEIETPQKFSGKKFYIRKGSINSTKTPIELTFTSDENGNFSFQLPVGTYCIIVEEQVKELNIKNYNTDGYLVADKKCLEDWWQKPYYLLVVTDKDIKNLKFEFYHRCFVSTDIPCVEYEGPMPP